MTRRLSKIFLLLALLLLLAALLSNSSNGLWLHLSDKEWLAENVRDAGPQAAFSALLAAILFASVGGARQAISFMTGFVFGVSAGVALALMISLSGALVNFLLARFLLADLLQQRFPERTQRFRRFASKAPFMKILTLRLLPVGSNLLTNLLSGAAGVPLFAFLSASVLGYIPQTLIFALMGAGFQAQDHLVITLSVVLIACSALTAWLMGRRSNRHQPEP